MPGAPIRKIRQAEPFEVIGAGVNPEADAADPSNDDLLLLGTHMMNRNVGVASGKAHMPVGRQKLDDDLRIILMEPRKARSQDVVGDRFDTCHGHFALKPRVSSCDDALDGCRLSINALNVLPDTLASERSDVAARRPVQQPHSKAGFKGSKPTTHRRLGAAQFPRGG